MTYAPRGSYSYGTPGAPRRRSTNVEKPLATEKQVDLLKRLWFEKAPEGQQLEGQGFEKFTKRAASQYIDILLREPKLRDENGVAITPKIKITADILEPGFYIIGEKIIKVQQSLETDFVYAKALAASPDHQKNPYRFQYEQGLVDQVHKHGRRLTTEEALAFGKLYGACCICGRRLNKDESIEAGIGPVCAKKI